MADRTSSFKSASSGWSGFRGFQNLMRHRVHDLLLVTSLYDSFILSQDGQLSELILKEFLDLSLRHTPSVTHVSTGAEALAVAGRQPRPNLIITSMHVGDMDALTLAREVRKAGLDVPVVLLAYDSRELIDFLGRHDVSDLDRAFVWQGNVRILLAIVKYVEDRLNLPYDTGEMGVQAILLIEDNPRYYSSLLPAIYTEVLRQTRILVPEGVNLSHKMMRVQARPKILLCTSFEEAWRYFSRYQENILGVISDVDFPKDGRRCADAGFQFARQVRERQPDVPVMLESSHVENAELAASVGATFLVKGSPVLLTQLQRFMIDHFGFGDFIFRLPDGTEVGRAHDLRSLEELLEKVPAESVAFHASRNHFSRWLKARTEFALAHHIRPQQASDFGGSVEGLRQEIIRSLRDYRARRSRGLVADFDPATYDPGSSFARIGSGSLGGKARGLAFVNLMLNDSEVRDQFPGVKILVPPAVVLGTDVFDRFLESNDLLDFAIQCTDDALIRERFLAAEFPEDIAREVGAFLELMRCPMAVRSSSLLEDSQYQPFAGIYDTYMVANSHPDAHGRLSHLLNTVKRVYASTFSRHAKAYLDATYYRLEEEKMAVILQKVVGSAFGNRLYPHFAGVARSHNFYPIPPMASSDGVVAVALGLGGTVVEGEVCVRFCPKYPHHLVQFSSVRDIVRNSQRQFYAMPLSGDGGGSEGADSFGLRRFDLEAAEADGTLAAVGSTYSPENDAVYDGISRDGVRLVSFAPILKHGLFPLPEIVNALLALGSKGTNGPVEIEFAVNLASSEEALSEFGFLQLRPLSLSSELTELQLSDIEPDLLVCQSTTVLGHGKIDNIHDIVMVDYHRFDRGKSKDVALEVERFNATLKARSIPYLLIGVGRWGSSEPFLGIPVTWDQISGARVIVEAGFRDFKVSPSQGTHFFQNLTSSSVGYFTVNPDLGEGFVDWNWLAVQPAISETAFVRHLRFADPLIVRMNGKTNQGVICKPGACRA